MGCNLEVGLEEEKYLAFENNKYGDKIKRGGVSRCWEKASPMRLREVKQHAPGHTGSRNQQREV